MDGVPPAIGCVPLPQERGKAPKATQGVLYFNRFNRSLPACAASDCG